MSPPPAVRYEAPIRVALVGAGFIAEVHAEALRTCAGVQVVAICDTDRTRAEGVARRFGRVQVVTELEALPAAGAQIAHLCTPPDTHVALAERLLNLGLGVFVEKPLALCAEDARRLQQLARDRGLPLSVNHNNVYHPAFRRLLARVRSGAIGRVEHVQVTLAVPLRQLDAGDYTHWMFRAPRNIVFEQATHPLSQIHQLLGPVRSANVTRLRSRELNPGQVFHERWSIAAGAERGTAELYLSFGGPFTRSTLSVIGTDGFLEADLFHDHLSGERKTVYLDFWNSFLAGFGRGCRLAWDASRTLLAWLAATLRLRARSDVFFAGMRGSIHAFHRSLRTGEPFQGSAENALAVIEWCERLAAGLDGSEPAAAAIPDAGAAREGEVVVLGATGFIGRQVIHQLLERGSPATALVRRLHTLPPEIVAPAQAGRLRVLRGSLEEPEQLDQALAGAGAVIHLATGGGDTWQQVERAMVAGSLEVAEACRRHGIRRLVYVSSVAALYTGDGRGQEPLPDSIATDPRPESRPLYARGKIAAEQALLEFQRRHDVGLVIARPGVVLGAGTPMQHSGLGLWVRDNHCVGWGSGRHPLPVVLVEDVARALVLAALHEGGALSGQALNLCADPGLCARDIVRELARCTGRRIEFHPRPLALSQAMEIGKWLVKKAGRRKGVPWPSYRDLKARSLEARLACNLARETLGWKPVEDREAFLDRGVRIHA